MIKYRWPKLAMVYGAEPRGYETRIHVATYRTVYSGHSELVFGDERVEELMLGEIAKLNVTAFKLCSYDYWFHVTPSVDERPKYDLHVGVEVFLCFENDADAIAWKFTYPDAIETFLPI